MYDCEDIVGTLFDDIIEQLPDDKDVSQVQRAGIDSGTPSDIFLESQGRNIFVTEV